MSGGPPIDIGRTPLPHFAVWGAHDEIFYDTESTVSLWSISAKGGEPKEIRARTPAAGERMALHSELPGGDLLVSLSAHRPPISKSSHEGQESGVGSCAWVPVTSHDICAPATSYTGMRIPCLPSP